MKNVRVSKETIAHVRYVMGANRCTQKEMAFNLGLHPGVLSRLLNGYQNRVHGRVYSVFYPRLQAMVERADQGRGVPAVQVPDSKMLNPPSTPVVKEFITAPLREQATMTGTRAEVLRARFRSPEYREKHKAAMQRYWVKRREREAFYKKQAVGREARIKMAEEFVAALIAAAPVTATTPPKFLLRLLPKMGFLGRLLKVLVP